MPDDIEPKRINEPPIIDPSGRIKTSEEIQTSKRAEQDRQEQDYKQKLLDAETRQANAQHAQATASKSIVFLTIGLFVASIVSGFVSYLLFKVADRNAKTAEDQAFITSLTVGQTQHMIGQAIAQTRAMQAQLEQMQRQNILTRQQLVGTQGAIVKFQFNLDLRGLLVSIFDEVRHVPVRRLTFSFTVSRRTLPEEAELWKGKTITINAPVLSTQGGIERTYALPDNIIASWEAIRHWKQTVRLEGKLVYDNGFGDIISQPICQSFLAPWNIQFEPGRFNGGGGFSDCNGFNAFAKKIISTATIPSAHP